ncbi:MAG: hypothetical protein M3468_08325 [Acidobacteriota bacterium]|nr:hypothetical protein [Acidobacteriota bacterium]
MNARHDLVDGSGRALYLLAGFEPCGESLQGRRRDARIGVRRQQRLDALKLAGSQLPVLMSLKQIEVA